MSCMPGNTQSARHTLTRLPESLFARRIFGNAPKRGPGPTAESERESMTRSCAEPSFAVDSDRCGTHLNPNHWSVARGFLYATPPARWSGYCKRS